MRIEFTSDKSVLRKAMIVLMILFIICTLGLFFYLAKYSKYIEITARIVDVKIVYDNQNHDNQNRNKYIQYKYTFNGEEYDADKLVFWGNKSSIGKKVSIKINPQNPQEIANDTFIKSFIIIDIMCAIMFGLIMLRLYG